MEIKHWIVIVGMAYTGYQFFNTMYDVKNTRKLIVGIVVTISLFNLLFVK